MHTYALAHSVNNFVTYTRAHQTYQHTISLVAGAVGAVGVFGAFGAAGAVCPNVAPIMKLACHY